MGDIRTCKTCGGKVSSTAPVCPHCGEINPTNQILCPACGSANIIQLGKQGFSVKKAAVGGLIAGVLGILGGGLGSNQLQFHCQDCGHKWQLAPEAIASGAAELVVGQILMGKVIETTSYGAFVELPSGAKGLIHISNLSDDYVRKVDAVVSVGEQITVKVLDVSSAGKISLRRVQSP